MWYADLRQQTEQLIKKGNLHIRLTAEANLHISRKVTVEKGKFRKKTAKKTNIIYLLFRVWHFVAIMILPSILGSENGLCQSDRFLSGFGQNGEFWNFC